MVCRDDIKVLGIGAHVLSLLVSMLLHMLVVVIFVIVKHDKERVFRVELVMQEKSLNPRLSAVSQQPEKTKHSRRFPARQSMEHLLPADTEVPQIASNKEEQISAAVSQTAIESHQPKFGALPAVDGSSPNKPEGSAAKNSNGGTEMVSTTGGGVSGFLSKRTGDPHVASSDGIVESEFGSPNAPSFIKKVIPEYPRLARRLGKEGRVVLRLFIDEYGKLLSVEIIEKAGYGFDEAAVDAVKTSTFRPAMLNGKPVSCRALLPIRFKLR